MAPDRNLAQKTYDVFQRRGGRWIIESHHNRRSVAMTAAEALLEANAEAVRVVSESQRTGAEEIIFEAEGDGVVRNVTIVPIEESPVCRKLIDVFSFDARIAIGRLLRQYLDELGMTALEVMTSYGDMRFLERNDAIFGPAMQRLAQIQTRGTSTKPAQRVDNLYRLFEDAKSVAQGWAAADADLDDILAADGMPGLIAAAVEHFHDRDQRDMAILTTIAAHTGSAGDWNGKVEALLGLMDGADPDVVAGYLDGTVAEILDIPRGLDDILGGMGDAATAYRSIARLARGESPLKNPRSCITQLNDALAHHDLVLTREVLFDRIARGLASTRPLTLEDAAAEKEALLSIVEELSDDAGLLGGPAIAEAVVARARIALKTGHDDLEPEAAIDAVLANLPCRAARLGFLLDVMASPVGAKDPSTLVGKLHGSVSGIQGASGLVAEGAGRNAVHRAVEGLRRRLASEALPGEFREIFTRAFEGLMQQSVPEATTDVTNRPEDSPDGTEPPVKPSPRQVGGNLDRKTVKGGEVIFDQGARGDAAYLILDGTVEIYRTAGSKEISIATLGRGEIFGEMSLIDNGVRVASARAQTGTVLSVIDREMIEDRLDKLQSTDRVLRRLIDVFVGRLREEVNRRY